MHRIFSDFVPYSGPERKNVDWIGMRYDESWWAAAISPIQPPIGEEYFEWIDLLEVVASCRRAFTMIEIGAGFGRWGIRGALAALQRRIPSIDIRFVEAEPQHAAWIEEALSLNGLDGIDHRIVRAPMSYSGRSMQFTIGSKDLNARSWYGQAAFSEHFATDETGRTYFGYPVMITPWQHEIIQIDPITFEALTADLEFIDFVDMDIQGAEGELIENAIDTFDEKVRLVHIGTHSVEIESTIRQIFRDRGWRCRWDFSLQGERETPFGVTTFGDGVQSWSNPRFWGVQTDGSK